MHVAIIIDEERLANEQLMLNRLCVGLMAEGVQVTRIVPDELRIESIDEGEQRIALATRLETSMRVLPWLRRRRAEQLAEAMPRGAPQVVYAVGREAWSVGIDLGEFIKRPVLLEVATQNAAMHVPRANASSMIAGYVTPSQTIARSLARLGDDSLVHLVPMGIALPAVDRIALDEDETAFAVVVLGTAADITAYLPMMRGLAKLRERCHALQVFMELAGPAEHEIWREAERLELIGCVSAVGRASMYRALLTRCHVMLLPDGAHDPRTIVLEAMSLGMPIVANAVASEDQAEWLIDGETATCLRRATEQGWLDTMTRMNEKPGEFRAMVEQARHYVQQQHRSSDQVNRLLATLERASAGGGYRLPEG